MRSDRFDPAGDGLPPPHRGGAAALLLVVVIAAAYANTVTSPFLPDDVIAISLNPDVHEIGSSLRAFDDDRRTSVSGRPLASLTLALNYAIGGNSVAGYHATNVLLHAVAALLLYSFVLATLGRVAGEPASPRRQSWAALTLALLWALHPLATDAVNYVVQRAEILASVFMLLALRLSIRGAAPGARGSWSAATVAACGFAMLSKESAATGPLLALVYDACFLSRSWGGALTRRPRMYAGLAATWALLAVVVVTSGARDDVAGFDLGVSPWEYLLAQSSVIVHYLRLSIWPTGLVVSARDWPIPTSLVEVWPSAILISALLAATVALAVRRSWLGFAGVCFFGVLAPSSSFIPIVTEVAAEHRMYLPLAAVLAVLLAGAGAVLRYVTARLELTRAAASRGTFGLTLAAALALGVSTHLRNRDYRSGSSIWLDVISKRPRDFVAHAALGFALEESGELERAVEEYRRSVLLDPTFVDGWFNMGFALRKLGREREAVQSFWMAEQLRARLAHDRTLP